MIRSRVAVVVLLLGVLWGGLTVDDWWFVGVGSIFGAFAWLGWYSERKGWIT